MSDLLVSERRIKPIQDAVDAGNWKQALQQCEKWQKKGERSDRFLAIRAHVLLNQQDRALYSRGAEETNQLCHRTPAVTDLEALIQIQDSFRSLSVASNDSLKLWERAAAAKPQDKELVMTWLNRSVAENNWLAAQKATMALRKGFPKDRNYDFWNTLMCYLISKDMSASEKDRTLYGTLAYRMICKAAEAVPADNKQLLSDGKALQTPEELYLLVKISIGTGHAREALELVRSDRFTLASRFAKQDFQLVEALLVELYEASEAWPEAFAYSKELLTPGSGSNRNDDERVWNLLVRSVKSLKDTETSLDATDLIRTILLEKEDKLRMVYRAQLQLLTSPEVTDDESDELLQVLSVYWQKYRRKVYCYEDLKDAAAALKPSDRNKFFEQQREHRVEHADQHDPVTSLNALKFRYGFGLLQDASQKDLGLFATEALETYRQSLATPSSCPEAGMLAAMSLVRMAYAGAPKASYLPSHGQYLLRAMLVLDACREHATDYYPYALLLVRMESVLGLMSLVMKDFKSLSIKNMQWETTGHLLLTRISTLHPHTFGQSTPPTVAGTAPLRALGQALSISNAFQDTASSQIRSGLKNSSYVNVFESVHLKSDLENSLSRQLLHCEEARIKRMLSLPQRDRKPPGNAPFTDHRDQSYLPSYESSDSPNFRDFLNCGPLPDAGWLDGISLYDRTMRISDSMLNDQLSAHDIEGFEDAISAASLSVQRKKDGFTEIELDNLTIHVCLANLTLRTMKGEELETSDSSELLTALEQWLTQKISSDIAGHPTKLGISLAHDTQTVSWLHLHSSFSILETLRSITVFLDTFGGKSKVSKAKHVRMPKEKLAELEKLVDEVEAAVHHGARDLKQQINAPGMLGMLMDIGLGRNELDELSPIGKVIEQLADAASLETFCGMIRDSWEDGLDGILAVKARPGK